MSTRYTVTVSCDERTSPECVRRVRATRKSPRDFDAYSTELFQQGWLRGFRRAAGPPGRLSLADALNDYSNYDVCPACADLQREQEAAPPPPPG